MTSTILLYAVVCTSLIAIFATAGWARSLRAVHRGFKECSVLSNELARMSTKLSERDNEVTVLRARLDQAEKKLTLCRNFIESLEPLVTQLAGDRGEYRARVTFWRNTAIDLLTRLRRQDTAREKEAALNLGFTLVDMGLSHVIPRFSTHECL